MNDFIINALKSIDEIRKFLYEVETVNENPRTTHKYDVKVSEDSDSGEQVLKLKQKPKALVISGGGGKGVAYAGMVTAMEEDGFLEQLTHISGASAGAMVASLIALGMKAADINAIVTYLDIERLVDPAKGEFRGKGDTFRNSLDIFYMFQIDSHLKEVQRHLEEENNPSTEIIDKYLQLKAKVLKYREALLKIDQEFSTVEDIIKFLNGAPNFEDFNEQLNQALANSSDRFTFQDLVTLREILPDGQKHLIKDLTVVVTNIDEQELETNNAKNSPNESIANIVQISGAHPAIFQSVTHEGQAKADGGIIDNMPIEFLLNEGMELKDIVCVCLTPDTQFDKQTEAITNLAREPLSRFQRIADVVFSGLVGGKVIEGGARIQERQIAINFLNNLIIINTGEIDTLDLGADIKKKKIAIENGKKATKEFIAQYKKPTGNRIIDLLATKQGVLIDIISEIFDRNTIQEIEGSENLRALLNDCYTANMLKMLRNKFIEGQDGQAELLPENVMILCQMKQAICAYYGEEPEEAAKAFDYCLMQINFLTGNKYNLKYEQFAIISEDLFSTDEVNQLTDEINNSSYTFEEFFDFIIEIAVSSMCYLVFEFALSCIEIGLLLVAAALDSFEENKSLELESPPQRVTSNLQTFSIFSPEVEKTPDDDNEITSSPVVKGA